MLCEWLTRAAVCSSAYSCFALSCGSSCTQEEVMLGRLVEQAVAALGEGRTLAPAEAYEFLELLAAKSAAEALLKHLIEEVWVKWDFCPLGFALERSVVFGGALVGRAEEFYEPYRFLMRHFGLMHVFAKAHSDKEREDTFRHYGAEAVVTCIRRPPRKLKMYMASSDVPSPAAEAVAKALGVQLQTGSIRIAPGVYVV